LDDDGLVAITGIICLAAIAVAAITHGIDTFLATSIGSLIAGLAGYRAGRRRRRA
jgi:urea transporter